MNLLDGVLYRAPDEDGGGEAEIDADVDVADIADDAMAESEPVEAEPVGPTSLADDAQYAWEGLEEPLTGKDIREGWMRNADYTQKTQEIAAQRQAFEQHQQQMAQWQQYAQQLEQQLQQAQLQPQQVQQQEPQASPLDDWYAAVEAKGGYADVNDMRQLINAVEGSTFSELRQGQDQLAGAMTQILQDYMQTKQQLNQLLSGHTSNQEQQLLDEALRFAEVPEDVHDTAAEFARDMLLSYEPDPNAGETMETLQASFPSMFRERWQKMMELSRARDKADLERAKKSSAPGKGGSASPSKSVKPEMDPSKIAEMFG